MVRMPAGHLPSLPMEAARLFPEPAAGEPYTILIMTTPIDSGLVLGFRKLSLSIIDNFAIFFLILLHIFLLF
jgi:hypothetical protein